MNTIRALWDKYDEVEVPFDYLNFYIDDFWLDEKLDELYPDNQYKGTVPTLIIDMMWEPEKKVVWERILPPFGETAICPILVCPDNLDFSCTTIVAEVMNAGAFVKWTRLGVDQTNNSGPENVGSVVEWFEGLDEFIFTKTKYLDMLMAFKTEFEYDRTDWLNKWKEEGTEGYELYLPDMKNWY